MIRDSVGSLAYLSLMDLAHRSLVKGSSRGSFGGPVGPKPKISSTICEASMLYGLLTVGGRGSLFLLGGVPPSCTGSGSTARTGASMASSCSWRHLLWHVCIACIEYISMVCSAIS